MNIKIDINVCRVCLQSDDDNLLSLFDDETITEKFKSITQLKIEKGDGYPQSICRKCNTRLNVAADFREQSIQSFDHLATFISEVNKKFTTVTNQQRIQQQKRRQITSDLDELEYILSTDTLDDDQSVKPSSPQAKKFKFLKQEIDIDDVEGGFSNDGSDNAMQESTQRPNDSTATNEECLGGGGEVSSRFERDDDELEYFLEYGSAIERETAEPIVDTIDDSGGSTKPDSTESVGERDHAEQIYLNEDFITRDEPSTTEPTIIDDIELINNPLSDIHFCTKCNRDFSTRTNLLRHLRTHNGIKPYKCTICDQQFTQNTSLKAHMHLHTGNRPYKCDMCEKAFTQCKSLISHKRIHTGEKPFTCSVCGFVFRQKDGLKRHMASRHNKDAAYECPVCKKIFDSKYSLRLHMRVHKGGSSHHYVDGDEVDDGESSVITNIEYQQSNDNSMDVRTEYVCNECKQLFETFEELSEHMRSHNIFVDEMIEFVCDICLEAFESKEQLAIHCKNNGHMATNKKYSCTKCSKSFGFTSSLMKHLKTHNIDKSELYSCSVCAMGFSNEAEYKLHSHYNLLDVKQPKDNGAFTIQIVEDSNDITVMKCEICDVEFETEDAIREHFRDHHNQEILAITDHEMDD